MKTVWKIYFFFYVLMTLVDLYLAAHFGGPRLEIFHGLAINGVTSVGLYMYSFKVDPISVRFWKVFFYVILLDFVYDLFAYGFSGTSTVLLGILVLPAFIGIYLLGFGEKGPGKPE